MNNSVLLEEQKKRFQQILEFTYRGYNNNLGEAEDDEPQADAQTQQDNSAPFDNTQDMGGEMPVDGGMPQDDMTQTNNAPDMGEEMPVDNGMPQDSSQQQTPQGFNPQETDGIDNGDISTSDFEGEPGPDDNVVDISELTDAQESTEDAVKEVGDKFDKVIKYLGQWEEMIKSNNEKIEDLKAEFEKRNPTQIEKLGMQTAKSYPFNVTPDEYWKEKAATSNYRTEDDDNGKEQGQYTITKNDIDGTTDWKGIADSLDDDAIYHPTLKNTMGYGL